MVVLQGVFLLVSLPGCGLSPQGTHPPNVDGDGTGSEQGDTAGPADTDETPTSPPDDTAPPVQYGETVARVGLDVPVDAPNFIRATLPVPKGLFVPGGMVGVGIQGPDGVLADAQVETVSRYPDGSADVVEILAQPSTLQGGEWTSFDVVLGKLGAPKPEPFDRAVEDTLALHPAVEALLVSPVELRTSDALGNQYGTELLALQGTADRWGPSAIRVKAHRGLVPDSGSVDARDPILGVFSWVGLYADLPIVTIDVRIHNGWFGTPESRTPIRDTYFDELRVSLPDGWTLLQDVEDPMFDGAAGLVVAPNSDGTFHFIPAQGMFHRRLALVPKGEEALGRAFLDERVLAFSGEGTTDDGSELWSWWNEDTARYFPQKMALPRYDYLGQSTVRSDLTDTKVDIETLFTTGTSGLSMETGNLGWAHPWGVPYGGMTGGTEVYFHEGVAAAWAASPDGVRASELRFRANEDRQFVALFDEEGRPPHVEDFLTGDDPYVPFSFFHNPNDDHGYEFFQLEQTIDATITAVTSAGLEPDYQATLDGYSGHDQQHLVRYTKDPKALVYLSNDALSKDALLLEGELHHLSYHQYATNASGTYTSAMRTAMDRAATYPHRGIDHGRGQGWGFDALNVAYATSQDDAWRADIRTYLDLYVQLIEDAQVECSGALQANYNAGKLLDNYYARQVWEDNISQNGVQGLYEAVYRDIDGGSWNPRLETWLAQAYGSVIGPAGWGASASAPYAIAATVTLDESSTFCSSLPADGYEGASNFYLAPFMARAWKLTGDTTYLDLSVLSWGGNTTDMQGQLEESDWGYNTENEGELLRVMQDLGWTVP